MSPTTRIHTHAARSNARIAGEPNALFVVGDYVGRAPGEAAYAVWRAGLLARLDRLAGHGPVLTGRIAAQEPEPGQTLARGGVVTLLMVAPEDDDVENADDANSHRGDSLAESDNAVALGPSSVFGDEPVIDVCLSALALAVVTSRVLGDNLRSVADALRRHVLEAEQRARALLALIGDSHCDDVAVSRGDREGP